MTNADTIRTFVAIETSAELKTGLGRVIEQLNSMVPRKSVRWVRKENIHLTLRFLGDVDRSGMEMLESVLIDAAKGLKSFELRLGKPGCFPSIHSPRVLWISVEGALEILGDLQAKVCEKTKDFGKPDDHGFHPHLTLGRVTTVRGSELKAIGTALGGVKIECLGPWKVDAFHLMQSVVAPGGSRYSKLATVALS